MTTRRFDGKPERGPDRPIDQDRYPVEAVRAAFERHMPKRRRPKRLTTRAQHAIDAIADVLESDRIGGSDRVALEGARAALDKYTEV